MKFFMLKKSKVFVRKKTNSYKGLGVGTYSNLSTREKWVSGRLK